MLPYEPSGVCFARVRVHHEQRVVALLNGWPGLEQRDVRALSKSDCLDWAAKFARQTCSSAFNNTVAILRRALDVVVELGVPRPSRGASAVKTPTPEPAASEIAAKTEERIHEFFDHVRDVRQEYAGDHDPRKSFESWAIQKIAALQYPVLHLAEAVAEPR